MSIKTSLRDRPLVLILAAVVMQAIVQGFMTEDISPAGSLAFSAMAFATAAAVFGCIGTMRRSDAAPATRATRVSMIWMNIATAATFLSFYVSISLIPASTTSSIESALGPVALMVIAWVVSRRREWRGTTELLLIAVMMGLGLLLAFRTWQDSGPNAGSAQTVAGLLLAIVAAIGMAAVVLLSKTMGNRGIGATWVTANRFHLTYVLAALVWMVSGAHPPDAGELTRLFLFGIVAVVIPLFLLQVGIQRAAPLPAIAIIALLPGVTWLAQLAAGHPIDMVSLALILGVVLVSVTFTLRTAPTAT
ncbi:hypothetical protein BH93_27375 (plasmid) [Rhodococcoides fascians A25f]|uniref:hypothetical protein n=1 Tax=Rhodococcoides fascians TaxID=1828 RepID=UPI0005610218|nr:hypothetical protein [Rhodococcus fascians]QII09295.1 hypothetical protein BH93_27375 [Rhodococcus fascians A25f]